MPRSLCPASGCELVFERSSDLTRHARVHTGEKPHICTVCGRGFSQSSGLRTHKNVHSGAKPFVCLYSCGKAFGDPSSCSRHTREIHEGVQPYQCPEPGCHTSIKRRTAFVQHLASKHHIKHPSDEFVDAQAPSSERRQRRRRRVVVPATGLMSLPTASLAQYEPQPKNMTNAYNYDYNMNPPSSYDNTNSFDVSLGFEHPGLFILPQSRPSSTTPSLTYSNNTSPASSHGYATPPLMNPFDDVLSTYLGAPGVGYGAQCAKPTNTIPAPDSWDYLFSE